MLGVTNIHFKKVKYFIIGTYFFYLLEKIPCAYKNECKKMYDGLFYETPSNRYTMCVHLAIETIQVIIS